jgi:serine/threonine protein kinase
MLTAGTKLGPYEIIGSLGAGGMGEVYRARDTKLGRDVALKVLPDLFVHDAERLARFRREAHVLASLNHPNIATIYGLEESAGTLALAMELVEGSTLAERLAQGSGLKTQGLPLDEALPIAKQIADALDAAHDKGIIHRDLKPANIKLRPDGTVKVLDFGLAKALDPTSQAGDASYLANSPTMSADGTRAGVILGTAAYMSPEQARGKPVDKRADIWAFGCVVYEMLTGSMPFTGETITDILGAIVKSDPDWNALPDSTPAAIRTLLRRCLHKEREKRLRDVADARMEIDDALSTPTPRPATQAPAVVSTRLARRERLAWVGAVVVIALVAGVVVTRFLRRPAADEGLVRFAIPPPENASFNNVGALGTVPSPALSPDGRRLAFVAVGPNGTTSLWVRALDSLAAQLLPGTENASLPFWSPDGRSLGFFADRRVKKIDLSGGTPQTLADASGPFNSGGTWNRDNTIVFSPNTSSPLYRVPAGGGPAVPATTLDAAQQESAHLWPRFLPDGRHFLYLVRSAKPDRAGIFVGSLDASLSNRLVAANSPAIYASGYLLFVAGTDLMAQPFDATTLTTSGTPVRVADRLQVNQALAAYSGFTASDVNTMAYRTGGLPLAELIWFDRTGRPVGQLGRPASYGVLALSPDGTRVAVNLNVEGGNNDVWVLDVARATPQRLTSNRASLIPVWSPDGDRVVYRFDGDGPGDLYEMRASGLASGDVLFKSNTFKNPTDWSSDGRFVAFETASPKTNTDVWILPMANGRTPFAFLQSEFNEYQGRISPDGRWIAYVSDENGPPEVYVQSFPKPGGKWQISTAGGADPRWRRDGRELFFISADRKLMAVDIQADATFRSGLPHALFDVKVSGLVDLRTHYGVAADGKRFLVQQVTESTAASPITVVLNWTAALTK